MAARVGRAITKYRGDRPGSWLASETKRLGHQISKTTLWRIETGESKNIAVADLLIIAAALDVPPAALLFPELPDGAVEALPGQLMTSFDAVRWVSGEGDVPDPSRLTFRKYLSGDSKDRFEHHPNAELLALCRQYAAELQAMNRNAIPHLLNLMKVDSDDSDQTLELASTLADAVQNHAERSQVIAQSIVRAGGTVLSPSDGMDDGAGSSE